jgi:hypothetical protein
LGKGPQNRSVNGLTELSSRPERTWISYVAAPNNGQGCGFP